MRSILCVFMVALDSHVEVLSERLQLATICVLLMGALYAYRPWASLPSRVSGSL